VLGLKGKMFAKKRHAEKALMKKTIAMHEERDNKHKADDGVPQNAVPAYLLEREQVDTWGCDMYPLVNSGCRYTIDVYHPCRSTGQRSYQIQSSRRG
jgi:hypothetical protein